MAAAATTAAAPAPAAAASQPFSPLVPRRPPPLLLARGAPAAALLPRPARATAAAAAPRGATSYAFSPHSNNNNNNHNNNNCQPRGSGAPPSLLARRRPRPAAPRAAAPAAAAAAAALADPPLAAAAAVALGYAVVAGSLVRSVPQIVKVVRARSAEGLSLVSVAVELLCYTVTIAYNASRGYPLNTYGEVAACWLQDVALVLLVLRFGAAPRAAVLAAPRRAALLGAAFAALVAWLLSPACPRELLAAAQAANVAVLALGSRVPQIVLNVRRGDAGLLSATSCALNVAGNAARAFTTVVLTRDALLLAGAVTQGALNGVLLWQAVATRRARRAGTERPLGAWRLWGWGGLGAAAAGEAAAVAVAAVEGASAAAAGAGGGPQVEEAADGEQAMLPGGGGGPAAVFAG